MGRILDRAGIAGLAFAGALALSLAPALAENFKADLKPTNEVPPATSQGSGTITLTLDPASRAINYQATYTGLSGPATAAHLHSPANVGANAPPTVPVSGALTSPINGTATLTQQQVDDLENGRMYFNIHTAANPGGEIRGQMVKAP